MTPRLVAGLAVLALPVALGLGGCARHSDGPPALSLGLQVAFHAPQAPAFLDDPVLVGFDAALDPAAFEPSAVRIQGIGAPANQERPRGTLRVGSLPNGGFADAVLWFEPALPTGDDPLAAGLEPGATYEVTVFGADAQDQALRDRGGRRLTRSHRFRFTTVGGATPGEVYRRGRHPGGPRLAALEALPVDAAGAWQLGRFADGGCELRLAFDQPIDPRAGNLARIQVAYDDPELGSVVLPVRRLVEWNRADGAVVVLRPEGLLPNAAAIRVTLDGGFRDLAGERADQVPGFTGLLATVRTAANFAPQTSVLVDRAPATMPHDVSLLDWQPDSVVTVLDTDANELVTRHGTMPVEDGVFRFRSVRIPAGHIVRGIGSRPLVIEAVTDVTIDGLLDVSGDDGYPSSSWRQYRGPGDVPPPWPGDDDPLRRGSRGGRGRCGGHDGGAAIQGSFFDPSLPAEAHPGDGPGGGRPGLAAFPPQCEIGSAGGGGTFGSAGDPWYPFQAGAGTSFQQARGTGGQGCRGASGSATRSLAGGDAGAPVFIDVDPGNDFWGTGFDFFRQRAVRGELSAPQGGSGGGAGGPRLTGSVASDAIGGPGGGGGGAVVLRAGGTITIGTRGSVRADGGHGLGGELIMASTHGGGGGGGSGGLIVLQAERIVLHAHGETFANGDHDLALSADGGVCRTSTFATTVVQAKYPAIPGPLYDSAPLGGFGGLGVIQFMVPPGTGNADQTNTVLDDHIDLIGGNGSPLLGADKQRFLGWRGYPDGNGGWVDDQGLPTGPFHGGGDTRPAPWLLPAPSRRQVTGMSAWQPLGAAARRPLPAPDGGARGVVAPGPVGPLPLTTALTDGWLPLRGSPAGFVPDWPVLLPDTTIAEATLDLSRPTSPFYRLRLRSPLPAGDADRWSGALAELLDAEGMVTAAMRVLRHDQDRIDLLPDGPLPSTAITLRLRDAPLDLRLLAPIPSYQGALGAPLPRASVRLGLAFHRAPERARARGPDPERLPPDPGTFLHDLTDPATMAAVRAFGARAVQWQIIVDRAFQPGPLDRPPPPDASLPSPMVTGLWLRFRF